MARATSRLAEAFLDAAYAIALSAPGDQFHAEAEALAELMERDGTKLVTTRDAGAWAYGGINDRRPLPASGVPRPAAGAVAGTREVGCDYYSSKMKRRLPAGFGRVLRRRATPWIWRPNRRRIVLTAKGKLLRMDNVLIVVEDLEAAKAFFTELGMELEGETTVEGPSVDSLIGLKDVRATLAMMRTPDGHGRIELDKFHTPDAIRLGPVDAPVNALGIRRVMFTVADIDDVVARLLAHGAELVGEVVQYGDTYRLAYVRGPEGIIVGLAEQLGNQSPS